MKLLRWILSWALWLPGHLLSIPMVRWEWAHRLYGPYNWLMIASSDAQGDYEGRLWPWSSPFEKS